MKRLLHFMMAFVIAAVLMGVFLATASCSAVRTITNRSEFYQKGDTSIMIQTKTVESYDATKKL